MSFAHPERASAGDPANRKAFVDETCTRLQNAIDPKASPVKLIKSQDKADAAHIRLTKAQAEALLNAPGVILLEAWRDTAAVALMLCTGIREAELCSLEVADLRQQWGGELALPVRGELSRKFCPLLLDRSSKPVYNQLTMSTIFCPAWFPCRAAWRCPAILNTQESSHGSLRKDAH